MQTLFLRAETTGFDPAKDELVELALLSHEGLVLWDSLIKPTKRIRKPEPSNGITNDIVRKAPSFQRVWPEIRRLIKGQHVVIYGAPACRRFFPNRLRCAGEVSCAMRRFAEHYGEKRYNSDVFRWQKLGVAAAYVGHELRAPPRPALESVRALRDVWLWMEEHVPKGVSQQSAGPLRFR